jgi:hypothetical protein
MNISVLPSGLRRFEFTHNPVKLPVRRNKSVFLVLLSAQEMPDYVGPCTACYGRVSWVQPALGANVRPQVCGLTNIPV